MHLYFADVLTDFGALAAIRGFLFVALFVQIGAVVVCVMVGLQKLEKPRVAMALYFVSGKILLFVG